MATDVAARGIHVDDITLVIQVDPPEEYKTYLHRSGRTGRAGKEGTVITLIPRNRRRKVEDLLHRAEREAIYTDVRPDSAILAEIAGPIAEAPLPEALDFGDSRGGSRSGGRDSGRSGGGRGGYGADGGVPVVVVWLRARGEGTQTHARGGDFARPICCWGPARGCGVAFVGVGCTAF